MSEATLLNHYKINNLFPDAWPAEKDDLASSSEEDEPLSPRPGLGSRRSKSRYSALGRQSSSRSSIPDAQRTKDGRDNLVQKDEQDPLGGPSTVMQVLRQRGLPVEDDAKLRNRFLLSSTTFSPTMFLSQVHSADSTESLLQGLDFLSRSIEKKSASLKVLVESNFERFVRAKATIDNVYTEMRNQGSEAEVTSSQRHSRHTSKGAQHFKRNSGIINFNSSNTVPTAGSDRNKKNALVKEMEYGVQPIKAPLLELTVKAEEIWGPALGGRDREDGLKAVLSCMERSRGVFEVGAIINDNIRKRDYGAVAAGFAQAQRHASDARAIVEHATQARRTLSDIEVHQVIATARMWSDVDEQISAFKHDLWQQLAGAHFAKSKPTGDDHPEDYLVLIGILIELGVDEDPIVTWLQGRLEFLRNKLHASLERCRVEIEILRRRLANGDKPALRQLALHLRHAETDGRTKGGKLDSDKVVEVWEHVLAALKYLLSNQGGILGELMEFCEITKSFENGKAQRNLAHLGDACPLLPRLTRNMYSQLSQGMSELLSMLQEGIASLFCEAPVEDISLLLSPIPDTPATPTPGTPGTPLSSLSPMPESHHRINPDNVPAITVKRDEYWEKYAFWPPYSNSLSGAKHLGQIIALIGHAASDMARLSLASQLATQDQLKLFVGNIRERCLQVICSAWAADADNCKVLEDWNRAPERHDLTMMPARMMTFEGFLLSNLQKVLFIDDSRRQSNGTNAAEVVVPPGQKLLQLVRTQFSGSVYKILGGMVENAEKLGAFEEAWGDGLDGLSVTAREAKVEEEVIGKIDYDNKSVRVLLTLSNIQSVRNEIVPHLITQFETSFALKLTEETAKIRDVLGQIDARLFQSYVSPVSTRIDTIIKQGIADPAWVPKTSRPIDAQPYVYSVLLQLVHVHTEVSTTAAPLTSPILKYLLEQLSTSLIEAFKQRAKYTLPALMQATLDVEFLAQTLNNYTTDRASEVQSAIYIALDERTDNEARLKLQEELQEMRAILKRLRESTKIEFACFKRQRSHARNTGETGSRGGGQTSSRAGASSRGA